MSENILQKHLMLTCSRYGLKIFRNNVGQTFYTDVKTGQKRIVRYGLAQGSGDLIGIRPVTITPDMVGQTIGQFVSIEVKQPHKKNNVSKAQDAWRAMVNDNGGLAAVVWDIEQLEELLA